MAAISAAAPVELSIAFVSLLKSSSLALMIASIPDIASFPNIVLAAAVCSASESPAKFDLISTMTSRMDFMLPSPSVSESPNFFIAAACLSVGADILASAVFNDVPAWLPLIPAFAMRPRAIEASSAE